MSGSGGPTHPPPPYPPPPPPHPPAGFAAPSPRRRRLWPVVVLAVVGVLAVGAGVAVGVVQPWNGEAGPDGASAETAPDPTVRGDLDGDGLGDVVGRRFDQKEHRLTLANTGGSFEVSTEPVGQEESLLVADFAGAGHAQIASWTGLDGTLTVEVEGSETGPVSVELDVWPRARFVDAVAGDFDGDGLADLAAYGQSDGGGAVDGRSNLAVWVLLNDGEGFQDPVLWAMLGNATYDTTWLRPGDFDGDGQDDLLGYVPADPVGKGPYFQGGHGVRLLTSRGDGFAVGKLAIPEDGSLVSNAITVGDFDGDGVDTIVGPLAHELALSGIEDGAIEPTGETVPIAALGDGELTALTTSDTNGDGVDDLVFAGVDIDGQFTQVWVAEGEEGDGLGVPSEWVEIERCSAPYSCDVTFHPTA